MLHALRIENYAIIRKVEIRFDSQLNIITGETGAGKSILLGALGLIMGNRADTSVLYEKDSKCFVEAVFRNYPKEVNEVLKEQDYDVDDELIIRREISLSGKSRAFVNDSPSRLDLLQTLSALLVDLNSQFELTAIRDTQFQLSLIDAYAENEDLLASYSSAYREYASARKEARKLRESESQKLKEMDFIRFQYNEIDQAELEDDEQELLEGELKLLENAEDLDVLMKESVFLLSENENSISDIIQKLKFKWENYDAFDERLRQAKDLFVGMEDSVERLLDMAESISSGLESDPQAVLEKEDRLNTIYNLERKHGVQTIPELLEISRSFAEKLEQFDSQTARLEELEGLEEKLQSKLNKLAEKLSRSRIAVFEKIEKDINTKLGGLAMPSAEIQIDRSEKEHCGPDGMDNIQILFKANKGAGFLPIKKVASGGETARLMLALKSTVAHALDMPTMIFDEIDTGVSGEVANRMGEILRKMSDTHQLICITHSPQVAARASRHYFVFKEDLEERTITHVRVIEGADRVNEIAKMLSGDPPTAFALENARELIG